MSDEVNRFGLSRRITSKVARQVRKRDGFGCVKCGFMICHYEHFDPEFKDAEKHDPDGIILLCDQCHGLKGPLLKRSTIARAARAPHARKNGFSAFELDVGAGYPEIAIGSAVFSQCKTIFEVLGEKVFSIGLPEELWGPYKIDALFRDRNGEVILCIENNIIQAFTTSWDVHAIRGEKARVIIRSAPGDIDLIFKPEEPNRIVIERINFTHRGCKIQLGNDGRLFVEAPDGSKIVGGGSVIVSHCDVAFRIGQNSVAFGCFDGSDDPYQNPDLSLLGQLPYLSSYVELLRAQPKRM